MADRLSTRDYINRATAKGWSQRQIAKAVGRDQSLISQIRRGVKPGENLREGIKALSERKQAPARGTAPRPAPRTPPVARLGQPRSGEVRTPRAGVERTFLSGGRRSTQIQGPPTQRDILRELRGVYLHQVQVVVQFGNGREVRLFAHGGYDPLKLQANMRANPDFISAYLERLGYNADQMGGINSYQVVLI